MDLTKVIESFRTFERIKAQNNWSHNYDKTEWWHFQYCVDKQATFSDELELIGVSESRLRTCGWSTDAQLDRKPG